MAKKKKASFSPSSFQDAVRRTSIGGDPNSPELAMGDRAYISVGIPIPLILQYFFDVQALPTGLVYQITGSRASRKSAFCMELCRMIHNRGGDNHYVTTEGKLSQSLVQAICGYPDEEGVRDVIPYTSQHMQDWQTYVSQSAKRINEIMDKGLTFNGQKFDPGMYAPTGLFVDSIVAQLTKKQADTIEEAGGQERGYATHVKALSEWLSQIQATITCRPSLLFLVNHCAVEGEGWQVKIKEKGGAKLAYESSLIVFLHTSKAKSAICRAEGFNIEEKRAETRFELLKSSVGVDNRVIYVPIVERSQRVGEGDEEHGRQRIYYQWGEALVNFLMSRLYKSEDKVKFPAALDAQYVYQWYRDQFFPIVEFRAAPKKPGWFVCDKYTEKPGDVLHAQQLGERLTQDPDFVRAFRRVFCIKPYDVWGLHENFADVVARARKRLYIDRTYIPARSGN